MPGCIGVALLVRGSLVTAYTCPASLSAFATNWALTMEDGSLLAADCPWRTPSQTGCLLALHGTWWRWGAGELPGPLCLVQQRPF